MKKFINFFKSEETPRWQIMLGAIFLIAVGFLQNDYYYQKTVRDTEVVQEQQRVESRAIEIRQQSIDFQTFANAYVTAILDRSNDVSEKRENLIANILAQDATVDLSKDLFGKSLMSEVSAYRSALRKMKLAIEDVTDVASMGVFWSAASDLLVARNNLLKGMSEYTTSIGA